MTLDPCSREVEKDIKAIKVPIYSTPPYLSGGVASRTPCRSSFRVHTTIGPPSSSTTVSPRRTITCKQAGDSPCTDSTEATKTQAWGKQRPAHVVVSHLGERLSDTTSADDRPTLRGGS